MPYTKGMIGELAAKFSLNSFSWRDAGIHYATLNALAKRGYLEKNDKGYAITTKGIEFDSIETLAAGQEYFVLRKKGAKLGMMCSIKGADILDAWDNVWDWGDEPIEFGLEGEVVCRLN